MIDKSILKEILKNTILSYKDTVSNVNISTMLRYVDDETYAKCIKKICELEKQTKEIFKEICPALNLNSSYESCTVTGVQGEDLIKEPYSLDDAFAETKSGPSNYDLKKCFLEQLESTPSIVIGDINSNNLPEGATREDIEEDTISLFDFLLETLKALPEKEHAWIEGFLEDKSKYKAGNFVDAIKDTLIYDMVSRLKDGELVPIPYKVYPEVEEEVAKQFKNYMISYENGLCRLSILDDLKVK